MKLKDFDFRVWDNTTKAYVSYLAEIGNKPCLVFPKYNENLEIELYMGVRDRKGEKIYEGDILRDINSDFIAVVCFYNGIFWIRVQGYYYISLNDFAFSIWLRQPNKDFNGSIPTLEIVGNIHQSKHLLEA